MIYRREEDEHWRLASNARQQILVGNLMSDSRQERHAAPYAQEFPNLLRKNREEAQALNQTMQSQMQQNGAIANPSTIWAWAYRVSTIAWASWKSRSATRTPASKAPPKSQPPQSPTPNGSPNGTPNGSPNVNPDGTFQSN